MIETALKKQVEGMHYKRMPVQPIELISLLKMNFFQGNIVKYISRVKSPSDVEKAIHFCELAIELKDKDSLFAVLSKDITCIKKESLIEDYVAKNHLRQRVINIITYAYYKNYDECKKSIKQMIDE